MQAWPFRATKPTAEEFRNTNPCVKQLVRLATATRRKGCGDWVWLSWSEGERAKANPRPQHACIFFAVSFKGAVQLRDESWRRCSLSHFDLSMKWLFETYPQDLRCNFVYPTISHCNSPQL